MSEQAKMKRKHRQGVTDGLAGRGKLDTLYPSRTSTYGSGLDTTNNTPAPLQATQLWLGPLKTTAQDPTSTAEVGHVTWLSYGIPTLIN